MPADSEWEFELVATSKWELGPFRAPFELINHVNCIDRSELLRDALVMQ